MNNNPPFYIGQRVVALETSSSIMGRQVIKGNVYTVAGICRCTVCKKWMIDIKELINPYTGVCTRCCMTLYEGNRYMSGWASKFAPVEENRIKYVAVSETLREKAVEIAAIETN